MKNLFKKFFINKFINNTKIFDDGTIVEYKDNELKIFPSKNTNIIFNGKLNIYSDEEIIIQSGKTLYLRGEKLHLNDHKPANKNQSYILINHKDINK